MRTALLCLLLAGCAGARTAGRSKVMTGIDVLEADRFRALRGKRIGLITNHTGKDAQGRSTVEVLGGAPGVTLAALFSPEHGFKGVMDEENLSSDTLRLGGRVIPIHSLYRGGVAGMRPRQEDLKGLDALVFDIQDIGARFYTYFTTMALAQEEAGKAGIEFIVLDRPNPINGETVEGPVMRDLSLRTATAVAYHPVAIRHGMTAGEIAVLHNGEAKANLSVVELRGWKRSMWYDETGLPWTAPSPNMPDLTAAALYPGVACLEFTNLSVGRGTQTPFGWIGAPWLRAEEMARALTQAKLPGLEFSAETRTPSKSVFAGQAVPGLRVKLKDRNKAEPLALFAHLVTALRDLHPEDFDLKWDATRKLVMDENFKQLYDRGGGAEDFIELFRRQARSFKVAREPYLLYK